MEILVFKEIDFVFSCTVYVAYKKSAELKVTWTHLRSKMFFLFFMYKMVNRCILKDKAKY